MGNSIELKSIRDIAGMYFYIPDYQRGYRWKRQQVKDLLDDIQEFIDNKKKGGFYCIQPLVVKKRKVSENEIFGQVKNAENLGAVRKLLLEQWEVIDGQQRLTTISVLLSYLESPPYTIEYQTREKSGEFLSNIMKSEVGNEANIDYFHIVEAKNEIIAWFDVQTEGGNDTFKQDFIGTLLDNVKFIWYESTEIDPIKVFTRLNIGKISLTNAELIKALFLNRSNFKDADDEKIRLRQQEIAVEWDTIEYTLQNDEFWLFLNKPDYEKPTRIDYIFDIMRDKNMLDLSSKENEAAGMDEYRTFRYFYSRFGKSKDNGSSCEGDYMTACWKKVKTIFQIFQEWFNDLELYHYLGFLIADGEEVSSIIEEWNQSDNSKETFKSAYVIDQISGKLKGYKDLQIQYDESGCSDKTKCRPILLLHNIQTVINQNNSIKEDERYKLPAFYKFPFHLYKKEKWDVEHIDSNAENLLEKEKEQKEWLKYSSLGDMSDELKVKVKAFLKSEEGKQDFLVLYDKIIKQSQGNDNKLDDAEKNRIWNFALLDSSTNRGYGNAIFAAKRRVIIGKDQGKTIIIDDDLDIKEEEGAIAFIPPCTKNVFLKYYNPTTNNLREWDRNDAEAYRKNIETVLKKFLKKNEQ